MNVTRYAVRALVPLHVLWLSLLVVGCSDGSNGNDPAGQGGSNLPAGGGDAANVCVEKINAYRATLGLPAYAHWQDSDVCASGEAKSDSQSGKAHGAFGTCGEMAQNECPGWPGDPSAMIPDCLAQMWAEGPGEFATHGHYVNMSSKSYTKVACGFYTLPNGKVWAVQNFR